ncbi:hypothetical protein LB506_006551 [Fusarium annulatum]|jgi:ribonuclease HI
MRLG